MTTVSGSTNNLAGMNSTLFQPRDSVKNTTSVSNYSMQTKIMQFSQLVKTETQYNVKTQNALTQFSQIGQDLKSSLTYNNQPISEFSSEQAGELVSEKGYFGVDQTSQRIADFVIKGAGDDLERLKAGREGILKGCEDAEKAWGGKLSEISYQTMAKSLEAIDERIQELGGSVVDLSI